MSWHWERMIGLDLETTAKEPTEARIVQVGLVDVPHPAKPEVRTILVNPGTHIPEEAAKIHGITDEIAVSMGSPVAEVIELVEEALLGAWAQDVPVAIFNAPYDLTVFDRELYRHHGRHLDVAGPVLDPLVMINSLTAFKRAHNLEHCCEVYRIPLDQAHNAGQDALATTRLLWRLAEELHVRVGPDDRGVDLGLHGRDVNPDDPEMKIEIMQLGDVPLDALQRMQLRWFRSSTEGFVENQRSKRREPVVNWQWPIIRSLEAVS